MECVYKYTGLSQEQLRMLKNLLKNNKSILQFKNILIDKTTSKGSDSDSDLDSESESDVQPIVGKKIAKMNPDSDSDSDSDSGSDSNSDLDELDESETETDKQKLDAIISDLQRITRQIRELKK